MARASTIDRLERLDLLASRLKAEEPMTVAALAEEFGVSTRTLFRDIEILRSRGLPLEADRGRGGGIRVHRAWGVGRISLTYQEAVGLLVSLAIAEQLQSPWLLVNLSSVRHKLSASFSQTLRGRIDGLRRRILIGRSASVPVLQDFATPKGDSMDALFEAFLETRLLRFRYIDAAGRETGRLVEPQMLMLSYPVWYLMGWDRQREAVRSFRCDRISAAEVEDQNFALRPPQTFAAATEGVEAVTP